MNAETPNKAGGGRHRVVVREAHYDVATHSLVLHCERQDGNRIAVSLDRDSVTEIIPALAKMDQLTAERLIAQSAQDWVGKSKWLDFGGGDGKGRLS
jgi:hypothetical protein